MVRRKSNARSLSEHTNSRHRDEKSRPNVPDRKEKKRTRTGVEREIKHLRQTTHSIIPKAAFARLVRDVLFELFPRRNVARLQPSALEALQEASEMYIVQFFEDCMLLCYHAKRVTLMHRDMILMRRLRGRDDVINK